MKKLLPVILLIASILNLPAQDTLETKLKKLAEEEQYETIINDFASVDTEYSAEALYHIGLAYSIMEDEGNCVKYMDKAIEKNDQNPAPYYIKAQSLLYLKQLQEAIPVFRKSIELESDGKKKARSYRGIGFAFFHQQKYDSALVVYNKAIEYDKSEAMAYIMKAQAYSGLKQDQDALETYYQAKENVEKDVPQYLTILFNIGLMEHMQGEMEKAALAYNELISIDPKDYHTYAKLIQIHYHHKEYEKAQPLKDILYKAHKNGLLDERLSDMFCIDQFRCGNKEIQVYERYEEGDKETIYYKTIFVVFGQKGRAEYTIQTEYSPAAVASGSGKYMLCGNRDKSHLNYGTVYTDDTPYDTIKEKVISIIEKEESKTTE